MISAVKKLLKKIFRKIGLWSIEEQVFVKQYQVACGETLKGKNVLITGGTSGIGLAIAKRCLAEGANVLITGRNAPKLANAHSEVNSDRLHTLLWDATDFNALATKTDEVFRCFNGRLDVLINNAGVATRERFGSLSISAWDEMLAINLKAPVFIAQEVSNRWVRDGKDGVILNISSLAGSELTIDGYSAAKRAMNGMTKGMARELAPNGIRVNALAPGVIIGTNIRDLQRSKTPDDNLHSGWIPEKRYGVPNEIAELAVFMVSDRATYMNGAVVVCDGAGCLRK